MKGRPLALLCMVMSVVVAILSLVGCATPTPAPTPAPAPAPVPTPTQVPQKASYHFMLSHIRPVDSDIHRDSIWLTNAIAQDSNGRITIDIFPANQLGDNLVVAERISRGEKIMQFCSFGSQVDRRMDFNKLHYLATNYEQAKKLFGQGSAIFEATNRLAAAQNIKAIASYAVYFGGVGLAKEPLSPGDPNVPKNLKIRVPPEKTAELTALALGYIATPISFAETFTAIQTGIVDGAIGSGGEGYYSTFRDVVKYFVEYRDHFELWYLMVNSSQWNSLSPEDQNIIQKRVAELEQKRWADAEGREEYYRQKLTDYKIKVITLKDNELSVIAKKVRENVWPQVESYVGSELMDLLRKSVSQ